MNNWLKIVSIIGLTIITQTAYTAEITDTYNTGDTLTATTLNTIKNAVNDNNTRISGILKPFINTRAPNATDDINDANAYPVGSVWVDTSANATYTLTDNAAGLAVWKQSTYTPTTYAIGGTGPAGGWVFYIDATGQHGLEATLVANEHAGIRWDNELNPATDTEAHGDGIGAGEMNAMLIMANQGSDSTTYAAGVVANMVLNNYGDWYLPSKYELNLMYLNIGQGSTNVGGFADGNYWSSSEGDSNGTWAQGFGDGSVAFNAKGNTNRVRAVRAF